MAEFDSLKTELEKHKDDLVKIIETCQSLYSSFDEKRRDIRAEKAKRIRELTDPDHAWGNEEEERQETIVGQGNYIALYDYQAQNEDELSFKEGDVITVSDM